MRAGQRAAWLVRGDIGPSSGRCCDWAPGSAGYLCTRCEAVGNNIRKYKASPDECMVTAIRVIADAAKDKGLL